MKRLIKAALLMPFLALSFTSCKKSGSSLSLSPKEANQHIAVNITDDPSTLDPRKARALTDVILIRMFMDGLTRVDKEGNHTLAVAKKVDISPDKKTYTFTLRDCNWSNGDSVTSQDFAYAWKKSLSPDFNAPNANMLYVIKNAKKAKTGKLPLSLVGIETPDEKTLIVTLTYPTPHFMELMTHPIFFPVNSRVDRINSQWADQETTYVGNGPFCLSEWKHHDVLEAKKNPHYWDQKVVKLSKVKILMVDAEIGCKMFDANHLSWDGSSLSTIPADKTPSFKSEEKLHATPAIATKWIRVNVEKAPFQNKNLRKALAYAMDRQAIIDHVTQGNQIPATGMVPTALKQQKEPSFVDHDLHAAQTHFDQALDELDATVDSLPTISLLYASTERNHLAARAIQDQWLKAFGIHVELEAVEKKAFFDRVSKKDYVLSMGNGFADFNDPINFLEVFKTKNMGTNHTNWENSSYTELLETSYFCQSYEERRTVLARSKELLIEEMPAIPIFHFTLLYTRDQGLKDVVLTTMGTIDFKWAHLK
ncbi:MAG: peptide ABC transporter substrate-binding protein [Simkaniaceae bacterium]|nr:peptide ABC transporter substrate-binding protein [Simkaniaceae bacterium]